MRKVIYWTFVSMLAVASGSVFTACSNDDEPTPDQQGTTPSGKEIAFDDAGYFEQNFVVKNIDGNDVLSSRAHLLDEGDPMTLYVGAESPEAAKERFLSWLTPGTSDRAKENSDGGVIYYPLSFEGKAQGEIIYEAKDDGYQYGHVTFSSDVPITSFKEVKIIRYSAFPENTFNAGPMVIEANKVGAKAKFVTKYYPEGSVGFVVQEKDLNKGIPGKVVLVYKDSYKSNSSRINDAPTLNELSDLGIFFEFILKTYHNFDIFAEYKKLGIEFSSRDVFWSCNQDFKGWWLFKHRCYWASDLWAEQRDWWDSEAAVKHSCRLLEIYEF